MDIQNLTREFRYNGVTLADPSPAMSLPQVRDFYANVYPEITSADIEGPEQIGAKVIYSFRRAVGTKGCDEVRLRPELRAGGAFSLADQIRFIDGLAELLSANVLNDTDSSLVKDAQMLIHAGRIAELVPHELGRLRSLHKLHCQAQLETVAC